MNIQNKVSTPTFSAATRKNNSPIAFKATLSEIQQEIDKSDKLCPGKKAFFSGLVNSFRKLEAKLKAKAKEAADIPAKFGFKLGQKNDIPAALNEVSIEGPDKLNVTLADLDAKLNAGSFSCGSDSKCTCGKGKSLGVFAKEIFEKVLKVNKPDTIELEIK